MKHFSEPNFLESSLGGLMWLASPRHLVSGKRSRLLRSLAECWRDFMYLKRHFGCVDRARGALKNMINLTKCLITTINIKH